MLPKMYVEFLVQRVAYKSEQQVSKPQNMLIFNHSQYFTSSLISTEYAQNHVDATSGY